MQNLFVFVVLSISGVWATVPRPRGVSISMASFYTPGEKFRCLDGSRTIPYEHLNDDYCDCQDGSDEPGTAACPTGRFHCTNAGYKPGTVKSSRVNDGVCDCCDGTDEYSGLIECVNNCKELGKKMREEQQRVRLLQEQGYKTKLEQINEGRKKREEKKAMVEALEKSKIQLETLRNEKEAKKQEVEEPETEAKDKHKQQWEEVKAQREAQAENERINEAFIKLDANKDNIVDIAEIMAHSEFDINSDGEVSVEEAKEHLEDAEQTDPAYFAEKVWPHIKDLFKKEEKEVEDPGAEEPKVPEVMDNPDYDEDEEEEHDEDEHDDEDEGDHDPYTDDHEHPDELPLEEENKKGDQEMPEYDEETKKLIEVADAARAEFNEADSKLKDAEKELNDLKSYLNGDYGPDEEFSTMKDQCYEYTDREYTYKLCPFDRATQRPKGGGSETRLGSWGHWAGPETNIYSAQKYEKGQNCWNGPDRSVRVDMTCGLENMLTNTYEPSRCEYVFEFSTPSLCTPVPADSTRDEL
ncbi:hypothetical protein ScPMuIL_000168 [Solemya velum]